MFDRSDDHATRGTTVDSGDEGGLRAPPGLSGWRKAWWWFDFIILVKLARLRFIAVLLVIGLVITQWDLLTAYYEKWTRDSSPAAAEGGDLEWFCPMHPSVIRDNGKEKCPICFMPLSKRKKGEARDEVLPAGIVSRVQLSPYRVVLAGIQTWHLDYEPLSKEVQAAGFVEFNERGQRTVSARIAGRIDKLFVNETGQMVQADDELASIYSPDLVVTVQNLLEAKRTGNAQNQASARRRLELLGIDDAQISEITAADQDRVDLTIRSPIGGHVIKKYVREGQYVEQGAPLYDVADLSTVWIQAQVQEDDIEFLPLDQSHPGALALDNAIDLTVTTRALAGEVFHGKLSFVYPHVDQNTRTLTIRCEIDNPGHKLRPGSTATVTLKVPPKSLAPLMSGAKEPFAQSMLAEGRVLAVPENAVIDTGSQSIVYREAMLGTFDGVRVKLGARMSNPDGETFYPVLDGLARGDQVVASGSFLVDAETRLNPAAGSVYFGGSGGAKSTQASSINVRPSTPQDEAAKLASVLAKMAPADRRLAEAQRFCPILDQNHLGSMGPPVKLAIQGQVVFLCCDGCKKAALSSPEKTLAKVAELIQAKEGTPKPDVAAQASDRSGTAVPNEPPAADDESEEEQIAAALAKLPKDERAVAAAQRNCVVLDDNRLGSMGTPIKVMIDGQAVFVCCKGCVARVQADPKTALAKAAVLKKANQSAK